MASHRLSYMVGRAFSNYWLFFSQEVFSVTFTLLLSYGGNVSPGDLLSYFIPWGKIISSFLT